MRLLLLALTAVALISSAADAQSFKKRPAPKAKVVKKAPHKAKKVAHRAKPVHHDDEDAVLSDDDILAMATESEPKTKKKSKIEREDLQDIEIEATDESDDEATDESEEDDEDPSPKAKKVAFADEDEDEEEEDEIDAQIPVKLRASAPGKKWGFSVGPYLWASAVDANVSLGEGQNVSAGAGFGEISKNSKFGAEGQIEAHYGRFSVAGDLMYGVVGLNMAKDVQGVMVGVGGEASSTLVDGFGGYTVYGDASSKLQLDTRLGIRYQRTAINALVDVSGANITTPEQLMVSKDMLAGARAVYRPLSWLSLAANFDHGFAGDSKTTWSAQTDATVRIKSHFLLSVGYRTLTLDSPMVQMKMHGPRIAAEVTF